MDSPEDFERSEMITTARKAILSKRMSFQLRKNGRTLRNRQPYMREFTTQLVVEPVLAPAEFTDTKYDEYSQDTKDKIHYHPLYAPPWKGPRKYRPATGV